MKFIKKLIKLIILFLLIIIALFTFNGYQMYKNAVNETSLSNKISELENKTSYAYYNELPENYVNAVIAIEDHRFREHSAIDLKALLRAFLINLEEKDFIQGGSTITQQVAKNLYFTQEKKITRKIAEIFLAFDLEKNYNKNKILELYVNTNYFGSGYYGVKSAANGYFNKNLDELDFTECTLLAGIPNAPSIYSLNVNPNLAYERAELVKKVMKQYGYDIEE